MNSEITVRAAVETDMKAVLHLIRELAIYENAEDQVTNTVEQLQQDGYSEKPSFQCIVAIQNKIVIGFAIYYPSYSTWKGNCLYLEDLLVTESHRRKGVGKLLFEKVLEIAEESGAKRFEWQVLDWNEPAINFYKKYPSELDSEWVNGKIFL